MHRGTLVCYNRTVDFYPFRSDTSQKTHSCGPNYLVPFLFQTSKYAKSAASDIPAAGMTALPALPAVVSDGVASAAAPEADGVVVAEADPEGADPDALSSA